MSGDKFEGRKKRLFRNIKSSEKLNEGLKDEIRDLYGSRGERAIEVVKEDGVKREDGRWYVEGREDEYEIVKSHCSCYDYVLNIATKKADVDMCYHALAKNIYELLNCE